MVVSIIGIFYDTNKYSLHKDQDKMYKLLTSCKMVNRPCNNRPSYLNLIITDTGVLCLGNIHSSARLQIIKEL